MTISYDSIFGLGICVSDIKTTPQKILQLAATNSELEAEIME